MNLTADQNTISTADLTTKQFLTGAAGTGKTTAAVARVQHWLALDVPTNAILVLVPQKTLALPYLEALDDDSLSGAGQVEITTIGAVTRNAVDLFWPLIAEKVGFGKPDHRPTFLSLETAQYFMARVVGDVIDQEGMFDTVTIDRNRLFSQIIDNLNKAAIVPFPHTEIAERLKAAWKGDPAQLKVYDDVQRCATLFREYCLAHNLLDFSLQLDVFMTHLWNLPQMQQHVFQPYKYVIVDNIEEDTPAAHAIIKRWVQKAESALLVYDTEAGYRRFLGADPDNALQLRDGLEVVEFTESFVITPELDAFSQQIAYSLHMREAITNDTDPRSTLLYDNYKYQPEMIDGVAEQIAALIHDDGVDPNEIVVLSPYLSDALRFSLMNRLENLEVPVRSHRPSRSLREESASLALLTLAQVAHPDWRLPPTPFDLVYMLIESIGGIDLVRAQLLQRHAFDLQPGLVVMKPFEEIRSDVQSRITFVIGERYDRLRDWVGAYIGLSMEEGALALDHFFSRLFGEVLSQPGFGFHDDFDAAAVAANLIDSAQRFRWIIDESGAEPINKTVAQEYVEMVGKGVIADQYLRNWSVSGDAPSVLLAPAYTYLMSNRPVDYQFWLNVGGRGWSERLYQPLTNPYVLSKQWQQGNLWTDQQEVEVSNEALYRLTLGLIRRCRKQIYLGFSELGEQGYEQRGDLLGAIQRMLRRLPAV